MRWQGGVVGRREAGLVHGAPPGAGRGGHYSIVCRGLLYASPGHHCPAVEMLNRKVLSTDLLGSDGDTDPALCDDVEADEEQHEGADCGCEGDHEHQLDRVLKLVGRPGLTFLLCLVRLIQPLKIPP